jgi:hypothetical protein
LIQCRHLLLNVTDNSPSCFTFENNGSIAQNLSVDYYPSTQQGSVVWNTEFTCII